MAYLGELWRAWVAWGRAMWTVARVLVKVARETAAHVPGPSQEKMARWAAPVDDHVNGRCVLVPLGRWTEMRSRADWYPETMRKPPYWMLRRVFGPPSYLLWMRWGMRYTRSVPLAQFELWQVQGRMMERES